MSALTQEEFRQELEWCDDVMQPGHYGEHAKKILAHDLAQRQTIAELREALKWAKAMLENVAGDFNHPGAAYLALDIERVLDRANQVPS